MAVKFPVNAPILLSNLIRMMSTRPIMRNDKLKDNWPLYLDNSATCTGEAREGKALLLGVYSTCTPMDPSEIIFTRTALNYDKFSCLKLSESLRAAGPLPALGEVRLCYNLEPTFPIVAVAGLGNQCYGYNRMEKRDEAKEAIRVAVGTAARAVHELNVSRIYMESFGNSEAAAEGAVLSLWIYQDLKHRSHKIRIPYIGLYDDGDWVGWQVGLEKAAAQNLARHLMETPSNLMTPTNFALSAVEALSRTGVSVHVKVREWAEENEMNGFLAVAKGSAEDPIFLELLYNGCDPCEKPIVLIGKGVTFDSGGLCLKKREALTNMRGDMGGAAAVVATMRAITTMKLPLNVRGIIPLCENMPGARATKPGDIIRAMNGKTVLIENTDAEGVLLLADAISYSTKYDPKFMLDVGTLTADMESIMAASATGVFTNCDSLWASMKSAAVHTGDRVWRFPLWKIYQQQIKPAHVNCDLTNTPEGLNGYSCAMAAFLWHFIYHYKWMHMDTFGVMMEYGDTPYLRAGMSGRPTRTLIEFLAQISCKTAHDINLTCTPPEGPRKMEQTPTLQ
ncbi:hypothetical protein O3M35_001762 [Rhynocoris fuscipes]|uniref:Cytosol aminopeptidase n=1 Tax=Rhynocoris fuscipes TaxID=488301 RepID=A0AAW1CR56_9HEMI